MDFNVHGKHQQPLYLVVQIQENVAQIGDKVTRWRSGSYLAWKNPVTHCDRNVNFTLCCLSNLCLTRCSAQKALLLCDHTLRQVGRWLSKQPIMQHVFKGNMEFLQNARVLLIYSCYCFETSSEVKRITFSIG